MSARSVFRGFVLASFAAVVPWQTALADSRSEDASLTLVPLGSLRTGGAEISAYDPLTRQLYVTNAEAATVSIVSVRDPANPLQVGSIDVATLGTPNSVDVSRGVVAIAIADKIKTNAGRIGFYRTNGEQLAVVRVGALPDMVTFSPDGNYLLVANEGEPTGYGAGFVDPEGSVSIIRMPLLPAGVKQLKDTDVRTASFASYIGQEATLRARGIRVYGPGANAAQDFEPEYITVSTDSRTAFVTLQENNAIARIDVRTATVLELLPLGYKNQNAAPHTLATYEWPSYALPSIGRTAAGQDLRLGGFSGLAYEGVTRDGKLKFITNTDRGPNGEPNAAAQRPFLLPDFTPRLVRFTLDPANGKFELTQQILLRRPDGTVLTGLPNTAITGATPETAHNDEVPIDLFGKTLPLDRLGGDFEGIVVGDDGSFWLPDEYRPALYHFSERGVLLERFVPQGAHAAAGLSIPAPGATGALGTEALPGVLGQRRQNRGMEGIALKDGKLYGFVQSPARNPATLGNAALNAMRNIRIVEFDPVTRTTTRQFLYVMDNPASVGPLDTRADKIGDAVAIPGGFLALERDDDAVTDDAASSDPIATITKKIYRFALTGATDITALDRLYDVGGVMKSLDQMTATELAAVNVAPVAKVLQVDLAAAGYASVQKIEGLAMLDDGRLALVNDNDFQIAGITIDNATGTFTLLPGYQPESVTLGLISLPGLDASDRDSAINIRPWPVFGMFEPDAIGHYRSGGRNYLVTANEGDARDWTNYAEEVRVGAAAVRLDATAFPDGAVLKQNANLGRLNITSSMGDTDGDGDYDKLYTLGGRSFSIWSTSGALVYDSESALERITAIAEPNYFNASNDDNTFDSRSDNKGPEPEGLALAEIAGRNYAFIGLERPGGIVAYDITHPESPVFVDYVNNRDFAVAVDSPAAGDLGPEGLLFIPAAASPTFGPLLVVANEISGTVTTYAVEVCSRKAQRDIRGRLLSWLSNRFGGGSRCGAGG